MSTADDIRTSVGDIRRLSGPEELSKFFDEEMTNAGKTSYRATPGTQQPHEAFSVRTLQDGDLSIAIFSDMDLMVQSANQKPTLSGVPVALMLPTDHRRPAKCSFLGAMVSLQLKDDLMPQLSDLAQYHDSDLTTVVLAAWSIVLSRLSGQESAVVDMGSTDEKDTSMKTLALNIDLSGEPNFSQLLERVKYTLRAAQTRRSVVNDATHHGEASHPQAAFHLHSGNLARHPLADSFSVQYDLELHLYRDKEDATMSFRYAANLYNEDTIERYAGYLGVVLTNMATNNSQPVASFDILSPMEKKQLLETWNETDAEYPAERCIHGLFEDQVDKCPGVVAIVHGEKEFTYHELNVFADHLARQLVQAGVKPGDFVALLFERSIELVVTQLAVLKAGAAYVPIDIRTPSDRMAYILSDTSSKLLVTSEGTNVPDQVVTSVLRFSADKENMGYEQDVLENPSHFSTSSVDTAYVMFTSGTTGVPKGVVVPHRAFLRAVINNGYADIGPADRVAMATNPSFVISTIELWSALLNGALVVIIDDDTKLNAYRLAEALVRYNVTCLSITPPLLLQYAPIIGKALSQLRYLFFGGEQVPAKGYLALHQHEGPARLVIRYGSTEAVCSLTYTTTCTINQLGRSPIGRPASNVRAYVLDKHRNPVPIGVVGELYIGGPGIATGYLNRPDLTAEKFLPDPFSDVQGARMYKSGDLARYLPDGNLVYFGRNDDLVKIRGYRVELGEIQTQLVEHHLVRNAAVLAVGEGEDKKLVAYVEADHHEQLDDTLREHLARMLPHYMIPAAFVCLNTLPLTSRGKIDRRALLDLDFSSSPLGSYVAPQGEIEIALATMWSELLNIKRVGRHDNFFTLGGHSLLAVRLVNRVSSLGVNLSLSTLFSSPTLSGLAQAVGCSDSLQGLSHSVIIPVTRDGPLELSLAQQRLWFIAQMDGHSEIYHVPFASRLHGPLDHAALEKTMNTLFARHESLRTVFVAVDGQPQVRLLPADNGLSFVIRDLRSEQDKEAIAKQVAAQVARAPFDLEKGPLLRAQLIQLADDEHLFLITMHHIVTDGWSMAVMFRELNQLYEAFSSNQPNPLDLLSIQYPDYAAWQRQQLTQDKLKDQAAYWRETLAGAPASIELPTDRPRLPQQSFDGASVPIRFDSQLTRALNTLSHKRGITMFMMVLAAWSAVLSRLSGQDDIVIGTPSANRSHQQVEQLIGFFVSTLALRIDLSEEPSAAQLLERVREATIAAQAHQDIPFEQVVEVVQPPRRTDMAPIFQVMFAWQSNDRGMLKFHGLEAVREHLDGGTIKFELELFLNEENCEIVGGLKYSTALFDRETIDRHVGYLESMLRWMADNTEESIDKAPILGVDERELLLETWNSTDQPYPDNTCIHHLFEDQVELSPESIAIVHDERSLTYRQLNSMANEIACQLIDVGVKAGDYVMLLLDRSIGLVASQIAVLKIGAAYVPIDTKAPADRQAYIASDCRSKVLITDETTDVPPGIQAAVLCLGTKQMHIECMQDTFAVSTTSSLDTAYVMYTSGSTGLPKGVMVHHRGIARLVINNGFAEICPTDRMTFTTNPAFDPSTYQVWAPLLHGASIVVIDTNTFMDPFRLAEALTRYQVTCMYMTHGVLHHYALLIGSALSKLKYLLGGAEQGLIKAYLAVLNHGGPVRLVNRYGPTETTVSATAYAASSAISQLERLPIGRPIFNTRVYVLDKHLTPVPIGVVGELYVGGAGVTHGYLNRPELTAERFLQDPFAKVQGAHMYKTGDLVHYLPDGNLVFVGRNDDQVKIRGFRVELGEIEARLTEHPQVCEAVVIAISENSGDNRLVAYVVGAPRDNLVRTLRDFLSASLPEYMVPSAFVRMDAFPLTNNGKIDRRALPEPGSDSLVTCDYVAPQGEHEIALAAMWSDLLKVERVGRHDNFFMLGGHSLLAVRLMNRVSSIGVHMSLSMLFSYPTLCALAEVLGSSVNLKESIPSVITPVARGGPLELSFAQQRLWFLSQMEGMSEIYHVHSSSRLHGPLDHDALEKALNAIFCRHESLRTVFVAVDGQPQVRLLPTDSGFPFIIRDLRGEQDREAFAKRYAAQESRKPFELENGPLIRAQLIQLADNEHFFVITMHHIITDGWSMGVLIRELNESYDAYSSGLPSTLAQLPIQYPDYAAWQRQQLTQDKLKDQAAYWRQTLAGAPASIELPTDRPRPPQQSFDGASVPIRFNSQLTHAIKCLSQKHEATVFTTILAAWSAVLSRLSGQDDIVIGTLSANRNHQQVEQLIGFFVSTLALRIDLSEEPSAGRLLDRVREATIAAQVHQDLPFEQVVEIVQPPRRTNMAPIFQVMFAWHNYDREMLKFHDLEAVREHLDSGTSIFELKLFLSEENGEIVGGLKYSTALFDRETIDRHVGYLESTLQWMVSSTEESIDTAPILGTAERELLLETWNSTEQPYPDNTCIHQLFEEQVELSPESIAIVHHERTLTYRELNSHANEIACQLVEAGVKPGDYVMLLMDRSIGLVASQIAVLKIGAAYVPIDTKAPTGRQAYTASDCGSKVMVTDESTDVPPGIQATVLRISTKREQTEHMQVSFEGLSTSSHDTAYVMYTSGSTGQPKGVMVPHRGIVRLAINNGYAEIDNNDRAAFVANPAFDHSSYEVWVPLLNGACIVIIDRETLLDPHQLAAALGLHQVTLLFLTTALLHQYVHIIGAALSNLRYLLGAGEQGLVEAYTEVAKHEGRVHVINTYGPTEASVTSTAYRVTRTTSQLHHLPIGRPISNTPQYVLNTHQRPVPIRVVGELYIGGPGVANGYLNRPDLTAERFLPDPFSKVQGARMYKTGDMVRYLPDGNLVFMGRNDDQVKIRGFRVELGEIEAGLAEHPQVREAIVLALGEGGGDKRLVAYVVAAPRDNLVRTLRDFLSASLPEYMIPSAFVRMDAFPLTNNGKIDRRALPEPDSDSLVTCDYVAPQGEYEIALAAMWSDLLKIERVGRHDNFFMLGGHSLLAVRLMNRVSSLGVHLSLSMLFSCPTLCALAEVLGSSVNLKESTPSVITPVARGGPLELSFAQQRLWFLSQMEGLSEIYHVPFASRLHGPLDHAALEKTMNILFARHESLRTVFVAVDGQPQVRLLPTDSGFPFIIRDLRGEQDREAFAKRYAAQESRKPFELENGPLIRAQLIQLADNEHFFVITMHHIITDGWSMGVLIRELNESYDAYSSGLPSTLAPLPIQYPDYAVWQRQQLSQDKLKDQAAYWRQTLAGAPASIELPTDRPRPPQQSFDGASVPIRFNSQLTHAIKCLSQKNEATLFMTILAAWSAVLSRLSGQDDIVIGTPSANRNHQQVEQLIGFFVSTLALRIDLSEEPSAGRLLDRVREAAIAAQVHQDLPFEQVVEIVQPPRRTDMAPIFQVMFAWQNNDRGMLKFHGLEAVREHLDVGTIKFELELFLSEENGEIVGGLKYSTALFDRETIDRHVGYLESTLQWMVSSTEESIDTAPILGTAERELLLQTWNSTEQPYPDNTCIHQLFEDQVELSPEFIAIVHHERTLTYRELNSHANEIACQLVEAGVKPGDYVMLLMDRSIGLVASQIAVLKIGAAYVPIDTKAPTGRQAYTASDCGSKVMVTDESTDVPPGIQATVLRISTRRIHTENMQVNFEGLSTSSHDAAYVMYTSGSTGQPKGVVVSHRAVIRLVFNDVFTCFGPEDRVAFVNNPSFDPSTLDVWGPLLRGASIVIVDHETYLDARQFANALERHHVTTLTMTNAIFHQHALVIGSALSKLKYLLSGAEQGSISAFAEVLRHDGPVRLINGYGPTEVTMMATAYMTTTAICNMPRMPIGRPISNTRTYVLDTHLSPVPIAVLGELYVGGPGIATGYLNQPELTAERFLPDPFSKVQGARMYKTGDMVRYLPDGNLVFVGRIDNQVKIRGFRVEPGEIETCLAEHPQVREAIVLALGEGGGDKRMVAYVVAAPRDNLVRTLRDFLSASLPEYMVPSAFVRMDAFPLTNNGKIDLRALPEPDSDSLVTCDYVAPQGEHEIALAAMWSDLLKVERVGRHDNFFMLGGHSLLAVRLMNRVSSIGVHMSLSMLFSCPTLCALAEVLGSSVNLKESTPSVITPVARGGPLELSFAQQRLWFLSQMEGMSEIYHVPLSRRLHGPLDHDALEKALNAIFCRHESLRTVFVAVDGQPQVRLLPTDSGFPFIIRDLRGEQDREAFAKRCAAQESRKPFELGKGPLVRAQLIQLADNEHFFVITMHHIITDGWSMGVLIRELNESYDAYSSGLPSTLAPLPIQYPDYAVWQRQQLTQDKLKDQAAYWRQTLAGAPASIELPTDRPRPPQQSFDGASVPIRFNSQLTHTIKCLSQKNEATLFMTILAAWSAVLSRLSGQDDIVIGTPSANRSHQQVEQLIGFFVSTLALCIDLSKDPSAAQLLERVRKATIAAQAHQDIPFEQVVEIAQPPRRTDMAPIFQVMFAWQNNDRGMLKFHGLEAVPEHLDDRTIKFELELFLSEENGEIVGGLKYSTALFDRQTIDRYVGYLEAMLRWMVTSTEEPIDMAPILGPSERELLLETWNTSDQPYPDNTCLHQLFENQVELSPGAVAIVHHERTLTYRELNSQASWIARQLVEAGVNRGNYVMLLLDRSIDLVASQIAVLKIGAAYVPIDTKAPVYRQAYIASDCGSTVTITDETTDVPAAFQGTVLRISAKQRITDHVQDKVKRSTMSSHDTAYVMYTSGSTGQPKGVVASHRAVARLVFNDVFACFGTEDRVAFVNNPSFDPSTLDVWGPLLRGACIIIVDHDTYLDARRFAYVLERYRVTTLTMTNAIFHQHAFTIGAALSKLKYLLSGAEQGLISAFAEVIRQGGPVCLINGYGPTEITMMATAYTATSAIFDLPRMPIGRPISNTRTYVLDARLSPVPIGVLGELYVGGPGIATGYLNRPELTAERFVPDPFAKVQGARMYKTGDLVHYLPDGNLVFVGRNDNQVKIRGIRVELGEIEARLAEHPQVREAVVLALGESSDDKRLVAYVVAAPYENLVHTLREYLSVSLPEYMIPSALVRMDAFPLTNNGKIDRSALPEPDSDSLVTCDYVAPQGELEIALAAMWSDLLKIERVGRHDNFFMLGGHSLLAVRLMNRVSSLGVHLSLSMLFSCPTLCALAEVLGSSVNLKESTPSVITPVARGGPLELSFAQQRLWFLSQMEGLSEIYHVPFASRLHGPLDHAALEKTMNILFARHESLRTVFVAVDGQPQVRLLPTDSGFPFIIRDLRGEQDREAFAKRYAAQESRKPFELENGPLIRAQLIQLADNEHFFVITMHHIITDGWSMGVLIRELNESYDAYSSGLPSTLAPLPIQYPDYAVWQRQQLSQDKLKDQAAYWRQTLAGAPASIELPTDRPRPPQQSFDGASVPIRFNSQLTHAIKCLSQKNEATLFMTILAAWSAVLSRLSGQDDIVIGTPSANRNHQQVEQLIGFFVSTLALRIDLSEEPSAGRLLDRVREATIAAQVHQDLPFEQVVEIAQPPRRTDVAPIFQVMFAWQNNDRGMLKFHGLEAVREHLDGGTIKFELELFLSEENGEIVGGLKYSTALFDRETIARHVGYLESTLQWMVSSTEESIDTAPILGTAERELLLQTWNSTEQPYPDNTCIHQLFEDQVELSPESIAIVHHERSLTYRQLNSHANEIACQLVDVGVKRGDYVMLLMDRSIGLVASQIAVLKIGAAYVPIDTKAPMDRQAYIASDCKSTVLITDESTDIPPGIQATATVLCLSTKREQAEHVEVNLNGPSTCSRDTAYVMYTSGSTGQPKGVMVPHCGIARLVLNNGYTEITPNDCVGFMINPSFDPSVFEVWSALLHGARLVIIDRNTVLDPHLLEAVLLRHQVTVLFMASAILHRYAFILGRSLSNLKYLLGGGEQALVEAYATVAQSGGTVRVINTYGPTEASVHATTFTVTSAIGDCAHMPLLPIGKPLSNTQVYVLDKAFTPVPIGVVGELYIGGPGVANGYLNRPELTAERFLPDPFAKLQGARMYKTGDIVRYLRDGNLVFLGRSDNQVKIRGFRVELGEIEARLAEHPQVREAVVLALGESSDDKRLVAYVVAAPYENLVHTLREYLSVSLPEYMIPSALVRMDAFPLTNNGKIDRSALPEPDSDSLVTCDYVAPQGELEIALAAVWSDLLKIERVGRHDNFFMLGGHSLLAVRLMNRVSSLGVHLSLSMLFSCPTLSALAQAIGSSHSLQGLSHSVITPSTRDGPLELSFAQQRLWFIAQMDGHSEIYHVPFASRLHGLLDHATLEKTLNALFERHESLRTVFVAVDGQPQVQLLPADNGLSFVIRDLRSGQDKEAVAKQVTAQEARAPFDLEKGPLFRAQLIQLADDEHLFLITMHHIITDGWSMAVMFRELNELYEAFSSGQPDPLAPLPIQYPDYAAWQRQQLTQDKLKDQAAYWRKALAGAPVSIELPSDRPRPPQQSYDGASVSIHFDSQLTRALNTLSQKHGVTMFMTMLAAWSAVLSRLSGQDDIVIGTPSANRNHQQVEQLIGFFVSTLALRIDLSEEPSAGRLLDRVREAAIAAQVHQDLPFEQVVEIVQPPRRTDMAPIFQVMFAWQNNDRGMLKFHGLEAVREHLDGGTIKFELELFLSEENGEIVGGLKYSTALFDRETIARHVGYLESTLQWMVSSTEESIDTAPILGTAERELLLQTWNSTEQPYPDNTCIHHLFEDQVELSPESIAIVHHERSLTYRQLNSKANEIACQLIDVGVKAGDYVMLLLDRSIGLVASQIAVLKIGAAYVPIDTKAPVDRQAYIAFDCRSKLLITDESTDVPPGIQATVLYLGTKQMHIEPRQDDFENLTTSSLVTAYVMYTSGSTGLPKGVMVHHRGIARLVINNGFAEICPTDRMTFTTNPAFDPSTYQVWAPLLHGASIVVIDTNTFMDPFRLAEALTRYQVTCMYMTHGVLHHYALLIGSALSKLKYLLGGAEQGLIKAYMAVLNHGGPVRLVNRYGPTETTVSATAYAASSAISQLERLPIGRPISNTRAYVLDKHLAPVPIGVVGELYVGGAGVTHGYLNRPELTTERFLQDPFAKVQGARMYKTGDMVRYLLDGNLVFVGRNDDQVKIRGFRVELGEIEARLAEHPQVREAVVLALGESSDDKRLVAYVVAAPYENLVHTLREYLSVSLPEYMIPSALVRMDAFPLTNNGKIDRSALPEPDSDSLVTCDYVAPQGELEIALAVVWSDLLKIERVGRHDNFFMLGGHSLLAVRMVGTVRLRLGIDLKLHMLFSAPTLAGLALNLYDGFVMNTQDDEYSVLIPLKPQGSYPPLFCVHPGPGVSWSYRGLAKYLPPEQPLYGLQARGLDGKSSFASSIEEMTVDYIDHIRKIQPQGPYHLLGWSFGGKVAHNMAVKLQSQGERVPLLAVMDTPADISVEEEEAESDVPDKPTKYDEYLARLVGDSPTDGALALKRMVAPVLVNIIKLSKNFTSSVYRGDILFFRATVREKENMRLIDPACWGPYIRGNIEVHDVDCAHVEMDKPEHIAVVGRTVAAWIEKLQ